MGVRLSAAEVPQGREAHRKTTALCRPEGLLHPLAYMQGFQIDPLPSRGIKLGNPLHQL
jgi:hypothetical protein